MKVKFKQNVASIYGGFAVGDVVDSLPEHVAKDYVHAGFAEEVKAAKPKKAKADEEVGDR